MSDVKWTVTEPNGKVTVTGTKKMAYVSPWKSIPEDQREKIFNAMRGALITNDLMENSK